jgi:hypothetical protein
MIYKTYVAPGCGVTLMGTRVGEEFRLEHYFPFIKSDDVTSRDACEVSRKGGQDAYLVSSEDARFGITTIFHLANPEEFFKKKLQLDKTYPVKGCCMTGLCVQARVLLPLEKTMEQEHAQKEDSRYRTRLVQEARAGSEDAMEELTNLEMETMNLVNQHIYQKDLYSVIDSFFMPYGVECDQYMMMGDILSIQELTNSCTGERFYKMQVRANDIEMNLGVLAADLVGQPAVGRRIKCQIWLQGTVEFA